MCKVCDGYKDIVISKSPLNKHLQPEAAVILNKGIVLFKNHDAFGYFDINYCPMCGEKIS